MNIHDFTNSTRIDRRRLVQGICLGLSGIGLGDEVRAAGTPEAGRMEPLRFQAGINILMYGNGDADAFAHRTRDILNHVVSANANTVALSIPLYQENGQANSIGPKQDGTPNDENVRRVIRAAHRRNLAVLLRPFLDEASLDVANGEWRGNISPSDPAQWWQSYTATMGHYAEVAEAEQVEALSLMVELSSRQADVNQVNGLARTVREVFHGRLTICFNWNAVDLTFADDIDFIGIDFFQPLGISEDADAATVRAAWEQLTAQSAALGKRAGKPVVWTEVGTVGSYNIPYAWSDGQSVDVADRKQAIYFHELCNGPVHQLDGLYVWNMYFNDPVDLSASLGDADQSKPSFNIIGRPAEAVIRDCYVSLDR